MPTTEKHAPSDKTRDLVFKGNAPELRTNTLYNQAYEALKHAIMGGRMHPGKAVTLRSLAAELQVSPMPVRDALNRLVTQRALELLPNRTVRVPLMTRQKFSELTNVRCYLEGELAKQAATAIPRLRITALAGMNQRMREAGSGRSVGDFLNLNFQFHFAIYEHAKSEVMMPLIESLWLQAGPFLNEYVRSQGFAVALSHHEAIIAGLRERDALKVQAHVVSDIRDAAAALLKYALTEG